MANNYTLFSFAVPMTPQQSDYFQLVALDVLHEEWPDENDLSTMCDLKYDDAAQELLICDNGEWGDVDAIAKAFKMFTKTHDIGCVRFEWANTCSAPRVDEFGGGCYVIAGGRIILGEGTWQLGEKGVKKAIKFLEKRDAKTGVVRKWPGGPAII